MKHKPEHRYIDELQAKLLNEPMVFSDIENAILENNLFGVDINEESVDIAKLSLWLRTAQKGRKLTTLSSNIKCGNSLIDDAAVAGAKAFNWQKEFPQVFKLKDKQAFHIVLTTHNSRTSQRMSDYNIKPGTPIELNEVQEIELTKIIAGIINENAYQCLAYNVCKDHVHLILVCKEEELTQQVQKIKAISSKLFKRNTPMEHVPLENRKGDKKYTPFWSQKFYRANLEVWELNTGAAKGYRYGDTYIDNAIAYIKNNRVKHQLPASEKLEAVIDDFVVSPEIAFEEEFDGGFDVVIGNPPYVRHEIIKEFKSAFQKKFTTYLSTADLYVYFIEIGVSILKLNGTLGFINPNKFIKASYGKNLKQFLSKLQIEQLIDFGELNVFQDAVTSPLILCY